MGVVLMKPAVLVIACAIAYAVATFAMKQASDVPHPLSYVLIAVCLTAAALTEIMVLRQINLGLAYILILGAESLLVVSIAGFLGEGLGTREMAGAALVVVGTAILSA